MAERFWFAPISRFMAKVVETLFALADVTYRVTISFVLCRSFRNILQETVKEIQLKSLYNNFYNYAYSALLLIRLRIMYVLKHSKTLYKMEN